MMMMLRNTSLISHLAWKRRCRAEPRTSIVPGWYVPLPGYCFSFGSNVSHKDTRRAFWSIFASMITMLRFISPFSLPSQAQVANHRWWSKIWPVTNQVSPSEQIPPRIKNSMCVTPNLRMLINNSKVNIRLAPFRRHRVWVSSDYSLSHRDASHQLRRSSLWTTAGATVDRPGCMHESPMLNQSAMSRTGFWFEMECEIPFL